MTDNTFNETQALAVTAVRVIETADRTGTHWTDTDRAWASQAGAAAVGESAAPERFVAERAGLVLARLQERFPVLRQGLHALAWRPWVGTALVLVAFVSGLWADRMGGSQRINVLSPPVLLLLVWNLLVYLVLLLSPLIRLGQLQMPGLLQLALTALGAGWRRQRSRRGATPVGPWLVAVSGEWASIAAALYRARATRLLHLGAAMFALGVIAGMYLRGLALEYRVGWESTFLDPATVHVLLSVFLAPGAWLGQLPVPDLAQVTAIRAPGSENAATWLHLMALSLLALVVLPRLLLTGFSAWRELGLARGLRIPLESAYFRRLLRGFHVAPNQAVVLPYAYAPGERAMAGLHGLLQRLLGGAVSVHAVAPAAYGEDAPSDASDWASQPGTRVLLFNMAATPEREVHGAFATTVVQQSGSSEPLLVVVDESRFAAGAGNDPQRLTQRRQAWRELLAAVRVAPAFVNLADPDAATADAALDAALFRPDR
ncbi:MAG: DUF2868 domain-containing protein [Betaproteobacteria bacterium]